MSVKQPENLEKFDDHLRLGSEEGQGIWSLLFFTPDDIAQIVMAQMQGEEPSSPWAANILQILNLDCSYEAAVPGSPMCINCNTRLWRGCLPGMIVAVAPACDEPQHVTGMQVCVDCTYGFESFAEAKAAVLKSCRELMGAEIRELPPEVATHGHA